MGLEAFADWSGEGTFGGPFEDITAYLDGAVGLVCSRGKDHGIRGSAPIAGQFTAVLFNQSRIFSFGNVDSPLFENLEPGREVQLRIKGGPGAAFGLYGGGSLGLHGGGSLGLYGSDGEVLSTTLIDDIIQHPEREQLSVTLQCFGPFSRLVDNVISTGLHQGKRTDELLHILLDAAGWPADKRSIQEGLTVVDSWSLRSEDAFSAMLRILASEGTGASVYEGRDGSFIFENRTSRQTMSRSINSQFTYSSNALPMQPPLVPKANYKQVIQAASAERVEREAGPLSVVWERGSDLVLGANESVTFTVESSGDPFINAVAPDPTPLNTIWKFEGSQALLSGNFKGEYLGQKTVALNYNASASDFQAAFQALSTIRAGNISFSGGPLNAAPIFGELIGDFEGVDITTTPIIVESTLNPVPVPAAINVEEIYPGDALFYEKQKITATGVLVSGSWTAEVTTANGTFLTASLDHDATAEDVADAFIAASPVFLPNTEAYFGPISTAPIDIWFKDVFENIADIIITTTNLMMSAPSATVNVEISQPGGVADFVVMPGSVTFTLGRTSGPDIPVTATAGPDGATVKNLRLRSQVLAVVRREKVIYPQNTTVPEWKIFNASQVLPDMSKATMLEVLAALVNRYSTARMTYVLTANRSLFDSGLSIEAAQEISNRITIIDTQTGTDADFFIDHITHTVPPHPALDFVSQYVCELAD